MISRTRPRPTKRVRPSRVRLEKKFLVGLMNRGLKGGETFGKCFHEMRFQNLPDHLKRKVLPEAIAWISPKLPKKMHPVCAYAC